MEIISQLGELSADEALAFLNAYDASIANRDDVAAAIAEQKRLILAVAFSGDFVHPSRFERGPDDLLYDSNRLLMIQHDRWVGWSDGPHYAWEEYDTVGEAIEAFFRGVASQQEDYA